MTAREWPRLAAQLVAELGRNKSLVDAAWRAAILATPRHLFVPRYYEAGRLVDSAQAATRHRWLTGAYADRALVTKYTYLPDGSVAPASSASQPTVVVAMLELLKVTGGERVLEIGTGTGYNAALLCHRLGADKVTSVDIDPDLVTLAKARLATLGYRPRLLTTDGSRRVFGSFDRIIATCAVEEIPRAWIDELAEGGRLVAPVTDQGTNGRLTVVHKRADGTLVRHNDDYGVFFMPLRH